MHIADKPSLYDRIMGKPKRKTEADFLMGDVEGCIRELIAAETKNYEPGQAKPLRIEKFQIPPNTLISMDPYSRHKIGQVVAIGEEVALPIEKERSADYCLFVAGIKGKINKGDVVGAVEVFPIEPISTKAPYARRRSRR